MAAGEGVPGGKASKGRVGEGGGQGGQGPAGSGWGRARRPARTWQRLMMSASVASRSTTLPLPSSPHCAPSTTVTREPVVAASCCSRPRLTPPALGGRSLEARVPDMLARLVLCAGPRESPPHPRAAPLKGAGLGRGAGPGRALRRREAPPGPQGRRSRPRRQPGPGGAARPAAGLAGQRRTPGSLPRCQAGATRACSWGQSRLSSPWRGLGPANPHLGV